MPVVPFNRSQSKPTAPQQPEVDDTFLAIATAGMHEMNRLFEKPLEKAADAPPSL